MKLCVEVWRSDHNREERHYFVPAGDIGYQHNTYLFGYNPELVSEEIVQQIIDMIDAGRPDDTGPSTA